MTRRGTAVVALLLAAGVVLAQPRARSVILMVPDGCDLSVATLARWYSGRPLALDPLLCGSVSTHAGNSLITCSAAAATAFATGWKTDIGRLAIGPGPGPGLAPGQPDSLCDRPLATVLEAARLAGKAVGLVATSTITHATPAAFAAHVPDRDMHDDIMKQLVYQDLDVVMGGGLGWLLPAQSGGRREDGLDLRQVLARRDCALVSTAAGLDSARSTPLWGLFAEEHLQPDADRHRYAPDEPSLAEMTARAVELLSRDPDGFFLMVEGSQVDWACHANDPFYALTEFLAFDAAVRVALDFAARDSHTLLVALPDHNCGGLTIGSATSRVDYGATTIADLLAPLRRMKLTSAGLATEIGTDTTLGNVRSEVERWWGITLADSELAVVHELTSAGMDLGYALSEVFSRCHTVLGWTTHGHTGEDVPLWALGPGRPVGLVDNTAVARTIALAAGLDLDVAGRKLYVDLGSAAGRLDSSDVRNPALLLAGRRLPLGTDLMVVGDDTSNTDGITVLSGGNGHAYGPASLVTEGRQSSSNGDDGGDAR